MDYNLIKLHWIGIRKDAGRGVVRGWFTEKDKPIVPVTFFGGERIEERKCHMFYGRIGKSLCIDELDLTHEFLGMIKDMGKNYKTIDAEKAIPRLGKKFEDDIGMYLIMLKMKR